MSGKREGSTRLRDIARESRAVPPARSHIDELPLLGDRQLCLDLSGLAITFRGLDEDLLAAASSRYATYLSDLHRVQSPLRTEVHRDAVEEYVRHEREGPEGYYRLSIVHEEGIVRLVTYSMAAWIDPVGERAGIAFGSGRFDPPERALENFCRVASGWLAVRRGGFFVHGASIIREGRAYVFFGQSGAGKSTLASMSTQGRVVSDDLTLVLPGRDGLEVAGSPFRGMYRGGEPVVGRFPLAGLFRLRQDTSTFVEKPRKARAMADLVANLPFVNEAFHLYPDLLDGIEASLERVPLLVLHFRKDPDFWSAVDASLQV